MLRSGILLRSDAPRSGDEAPDLVWPPRTVLDLRSATELGSRHPLAEGGAEVISLPLSADASVEHLLEASDLDDLGQIYLGMLVDCGHVIARCAALVAEAPAPLLVHCAAGRTGVLVAVLLLAAGVEEDAVVADT